jgi:hypothetical protein
MSKTNRRFYRTMLLGLLALGVLIWAAIDQFGISRQEMVGLLGTTVLIAGGVILLSAVCAVLWIAMRKLLQRGADK